MQKKIIALAIAAAFSAPAFADVTVYGVADAAIVHASGDTQKSDTQVLSGGLSASRIGVKSVQDAGDMKVVAVLEYGLDIGTSDALGSARQEMLAVAGGFGTVATGYLQTTGYDWAASFDPTSGSAVSPLQSMTRGGIFLVGSKTIAARAQRALAYISPNMSGVTVAVNYSTDTGLGGIVDGLTTAMGNPPPQPYAGATGLGNLAQPEAGKDMKIPAYLISVNYAAGPLAVGAVIADANMSAIQAHIKDMAVGASFDLTVAKLFATYQTTKIDVSGGNLGASKAMSFSVVAPVGPGAVAASYAKNTLDKNTWGDSCSASGMTVAWLQGLSKTATLYVAYEKVSQGVNAGVFSVGNNVLGGDANAKAMGMTDVGAGTMKMGGGSSLLAIGLNNKF
jgi:predicted porin